MSKTAINFWLDALLLVLFLAELWCVFVVRFVFPPATSAVGWTLWGWRIEQWQDLQFYLLCGFAFAVLVHIMLHWSWVCGVVSSRFLKRGKKNQLNEGEQTLYGVGLLAVIIHVLGIAFFIAMLSIQSPAK